MIYIVNELIGFYGWRSALIIIGIGCGNRIPSSLIVKDARNPAILSLTEKNPSSHPNFPKDPVEGQIAYRRISLFDRLL